MMLAGILPLSAFMEDDLTNPTQEQVIDLTNDNESLSSTETLQVPVTATVNNSVLNVKFTGSVPVATVSVQNALTGATVSQQTMTAVQGVTCSVPVSGLTMGTITVTNEQSGESVSGEFEVEE